MNIIVFVNVNQRGWWWWWW